MMVKISDALRREVETTIRAKLSESPVVDVYATAEEIRRSPAAGEFALEEIAASIAHLATRFGCAIKLGPNRPRSSELSAERA